MTLSNAFRAPLSTAVSAALLLLVAPAFAADGPPAAAAPAPPSDTDAARETTERDLQAAQARLDAAMRDVERLSSQLGARMGERFARVPGGPPRGMLGLQISTTDHAGGAHVMAVSPGGPAEEAGIKAGDVIVAIDGKDLSKAGDPGRELVETVRGKEPESRVKVRVSHEGKARDVDVTLRAAPRFMGFRGQAMPPLPGLPPMAPMAPMGPERPFSRNGGDGPAGWERGLPLHDLELATLSTRLGSYFGAKDGVLVVRAGANDALKLQDGDVILKIDGREPDSAAHATRILRSYQRGEKLKLTILRDHKTQTLDVNVPGG